MALCGCQPWPGRYLRWILPYFGDSGSWTGLAAWFDLDLGLILSVQAPSPPARPRLGLRVCGGSGVPVCAFPPPLFSLLDSGSSRTQAGQAAGSVARMGLSGLRACSALSSQGTGSRGSGWVSLLHGPPCARPLAGLAPWPPTPPALPSRSLPLGHLRQGFRWSQPGWLVVCRQVSVLPPLA